MMPVRGALLVMVLVALTVATPTPQANASAVVHAMTGSDGSAYWTGDHYDTFLMFRGPTG